MKRPRAYFPDLFCEEEGKRRTFLDQPGTECVPFSPSLPIGPMSQTLLRLIEEDYPQWLSHARLYRASPSDTLYSLAVEIRSVVSPEFLAALIAYDPDDLAVAALWAHCHPPPDIAVEYFAEILSEQVVVTAETSTGGVQSGGFEDAIKLARYRTWYRRLLDLLHLSPPPDPRGRLISIRSFDGTYDEDLTLPRRPRSQGQTGMRSSTMTNLN